MPATRTLMRSLRLGWCRRQLCSHAFAEGDHQPALQLLEAFLPDGEERAKLIVSIRSFALEERERFRSLLAQKEARIADLKLLRDAQVQALQVRVALKDEALNELKQARDEILQLKKEVLNDLMGTLKLLEKRAAIGLIDLLKLKSDNNTCGLFQRFQDQLKAKLPTGCDKLEGINLWKKILECNADLAARVSGHSRTSINDTEKLADICYEIYTKLSEHVHAGRRLMWLEEAGGGIIRFDRQPLTAQQGEILGCIGKECGYALEESDDM